MKQLLIIFLLFPIMALAIGRNVMGDQTIPPTTTVEIHITGFENTDGQAKVAIVNSQESYESDGKPFKGINCKIINNEVVRTIILPYGEYAIKVYHDENYNNELDTRMFGIPKERYGFSNDARSSFGPPDYKDTRFVLDSPEQKISITVQ
ncbi:MAG: DUF2141 domain-containing protein [Desulfobacula sp.]|nr:DUF2141 domain-containing protein [Desulfobacula sp.]